MSWCSQVDEGFVVGAESPGLDFFIGDVVEGEAKTRVLGQLSGDR